MYKFSPLPPLKNKGSRSMLSETGFHFQALIFLLILSIFKQPKCHASSTHMSMWHTHTRTQIHTYTHSYTALLVGHVRVLCRLFLLTLIDSESEREREANKEEGRGERERESVRGNKKYFNCTTSCCCMRLRVCVCVNDVKVKCKLRPSGRGRSSGREGEGESERRDNGIDMIFNMFGICFLCFRHVKRKKKKTLRKSGKIQHDVRAELHKVSLSRSHSQSLSLSLSFSLFATWCPGENVCCGADMVYGVWYIMSAWSLLKYVINSS